MPLMVTARKSGGKEDPCELIYERGKEEHEVVDIVPYSKELRVFGQDKMKGCFVVKKGKCETDRKLETVLESRKYASNGHKEMTHEE